MNEFLKELKSHFLVIFSVVGTMTTLLCVTLTTRMGLLIIIGVVFTALLIAWIKFRFNGSIFGGSRPMDLSERVFLKRRQTGVDFGRRDDEKLAAEANEIVRRGLDKNCVGYDTYRLWRKKNPLIFNPVVDSDGELIGFFDVFPLTSAVGEKLDAGLLAERDFSIDSFYGISEASASVHIYVATIMVNPRFRNRLVAGDILIKKADDFLRKNYPPNRKRSIYAYAHTQEGEAVLRAEGFVTLAIKSRTKQRDPLYVLTSDRYDMTPIPEQEATTGGMRSGFSASTRCARRAKFRKL